MENLKSANDDFVCEDDEIPAITYTGITEKEKRRHRIADYQIKRIARFFIRDLLNAVPIEKKMFRVGKIVFKKIFLRGTVVALKPHNKKVMMTVDDGSGMIDCFVENNDKAEEIKQEIKSCKLNYVNAYKESNDDIVLKACVVMLAAGQESVGKVLKYEQYLLGDTVELLGNLSEYKGRKYFFATHAMKDDDTAADIEYLEDLLELYDTLYSAHDCFYTNLKF